MLQIAASATSTRRVDRIGAFFDVLYHSAFVDYESYPVGKQVSHVKHSVSLCGRLLRVAQDREGGADALRELSVSLGVINTDAQDLRVGRLKFGDISLIRRQFFGSTRRAGLDVKRQDDSLLPQEVAEPYGLALLVLEREARRAVAHLQLRLGS